jgi:murein DD-endopeptidase MepM/ murein hydrolase activator NlpD
MKAKHYAALAAGLMLASPYAVNAATPVIPVPAGYGHYCSLAYPSGGWAFSWLTGSTSTPCENMLASSPGGTIARAGLWHTTGNNNVLARCGGETFIFREAAGGALSRAFNAALGKKSCVFTVAPTRLPIFGFPYGKTLISQISPHQDVSTKPNVFNYNVYHINVDRTLFGQAVDPADPLGHWIDRRGKFRAGMHESAYDWGMPFFKPLLAVAPGRVIESRDRNVSQFGCGPDLQKEVYIEHQVGSGIYAEKFVAYYAHLSLRQVIKGQNVPRGWVIGRVGSTGCSTGNHLHFGVFRTTNLSGYRSLAFVTTPGGYGSNGIEGIVDPYGWAAPAHIDPWAWMYQGRSVFDQFLNRTVRNPGAFSINLWGPGMAPPVPAN